MITRRFFEFPTFGRSNPLFELDRMRREMESISRAFFGKSRDVSSGVFPALNITENAENFYVRTELPGISADDLDIEVTGRNLTLSGQRKIEAPEDVKYHRKEREAGKFSRIVTLPGQIDPEKVVAKMADGVLTVTLGKAEAAKPKRISIN